MTDAERYRQRAEMAERLARDVRDRSHRAELLAVARDWRDLAERAARGEPRSFERKRGDGG